MVDKVTMVTNKYP